MAKVYDSILDLVGKTPLVELKRIEEKECQLFDNYHRNADGWQQAVCQNRRNDAVCFRGYSYLGRRRRACCGYGADHVADG